MSKLNENEKMMVKMTPGGPDFTILEDAEEEWGSALAHVVRQVNTCSEKQFTQVLRALGAGLRWQFNRHPETLLSDDLYNVLRTLKEGGNITGFHQRAEVERVLTRYEEEREVS